MPQPARDDALRWLSDILWPHGGTEIAPVAAGTRTDAGRSGAEHQPRTWWASPSAEVPHILVPADAPAAARRAVRRYHDGFDLRRRARSLTAEAAMAVPGAAAILLGGARVAEQTLGADPSAAPAPGLIDALADRLGVPDLVVAVSLSVPKSNRKPVLQLLTPTGRCLGWAKVGWSPIAERLVANESSWLVDPRATPSADESLVVPERLLDDDLLGHRVLVTSTLEATRRPSGRPDALPAPELFRAVTRRGTVATLPVTRSSWWCSVIEAMATATDEERTAIEATSAAVDRHVIEVGAWHGDLTPWNLMTAGKQVQLIDWELAADGAPVGFDLCHFHTQVGTEMKGLDAAAAINRSARLSPQGLAALGVEARNHSAVWRLYLVELVRRMVVLRADGYPIEHVHQGPAALAHLSAMADRHRSLQSAKEAMSR